MAVVAEQNQVQSQEIDWRAYRAFVSFEPTERSLQDVLGQLGSWLREKGLEPDLREIGFFGNDQSELAVIHHETPSSYNFRCRFIETTGRGQWRVELTAHIPRTGDGWLTLQVSNPEGQFVGVPRLARYLIEVIDARDGGVALAREPVVVDQRDVPDLIEALCDPDRKGMVFVAGTDDELDFEAFRQRLAIWMKEVAGLAQVYIMTPPATVELTQEIGPSHAVPPWTVRTYLPDVDPAVEADGLRHKILGSRRLGTQSDNSIKYLLGRITREHAWQQTLPEGAVRVNRTLSRLETRLLVDRLGVRTDAQPEPSVSTRAATDEIEDPATLTAGELADDAATYLAQVELTKTILGLDELTEDRLREIARQVRRGGVDATAIDLVTRKLEDRQARIDALEDELARHRDAYEDEQLERATAERDRSKFADEVRYLRQRLAEREDYDTAYGITPDTAFTRYPVSFEELVQWLPDLETQGVVFTGDPDKACDLDEHDSLEKLVRATWDALLVLADYVRAHESGECDQGVHYYLENTPQGYRTWPPNKHAALETSATMDAWGDERVFQVPQEIDASGRAVMQAHFKLGKVGMVSPRMYYLDAWTRTRRIYIGYIGPHLTNSQTN